MLSNTLISIILPIFARAASAQSNIPTAAGIGRHFGTGDLFREAIFSINKLVSSVDSIVASLTEGNNRTKSCVLPVEKVYGVNVRPQFSFTIRVSCQNGKLIAST